MAASAGPGRVASGFAGTANSAVESANSAGGTANSAGGTADSAGGARRRSRLRRVALVAGALLIAAPIAATGAGWRLVEVTSDSMAPTLRTGDRVFSAPISDAPEIGDIVVFTPPPAWREAYPRWSDGASAPERMVKRVIAVGGDTVVCCAPGAELIVNGQRLQEDYLAVAPGTGNTPTYRVVVPDGQLWLLGDNRAGSFDSSRVSAMNGDGAVPSSAVTGRVVGRD